LLSLASSSPILIKLDSFNAFLHEMNESDKKSIALHVLWTEVLIIKVDDYSD